MTISSKGRRSRVSTITGNKLRAPIALRGLPRGRYTVRVVVTLRDGARLTLRRAQLPDLRGEEAIAPGARPPERASSTYASVLT